jgi:hypothetical protein
MPLSRQFARRPSDSHNLRLPRDLPLGRWASGGARKIFVVKRTSHLPATNAAAGKTLRRILIFDNHPDSLRLVFGRCAASHASLSDPQGTTSWGVAFLWILVVGLMMAMFWPLF